MDAVSKTTRSANGTPPSADTVFSHREHGFLWVQPKVMTRVAFAAPVSAWIKLMYGIPDGSAELTTIENMEKHRSQLCQLSMSEPRNFSYESFASHFRVACIRYYNCLGSLIAKTAGTPYEDGIPKLMFSWEHWRAKEGFPAVDTSSLKEELCGVLFNLACCYSIMGCVVPDQLKNEAKMIQTAESMTTQWRENQDVLTHRCRHFRIAAILFQELSRKLVECQLVEVEDMNPRVAQLISLVMFAQAQECVYQAYKQGNRAPVNEEMLAKLSLAAAQYYGQFLEHATVDEVPEYWIFHCGAARGILRAATLVHYARTVQDLQFGHKIGYVAKAFRVTEEAQREICRESNDTERDADLIMLLSVKRGQVSKLIDMLRKDNDSVYRTAVPGDDMIDSLQLEPANKVACAQPQEMDWSSAPGIATLFGPAQDAFPRIVSTASAKAWLEYRRRRINMYIDHLRAIHSVDEKVFALFESRPEYIFLYFLHQRLAPGKSAASLAYPIGFFQTKLGAELLLLRSAEFVQTVNLCDTLLPESTRKVRLACLELRDALATADQTLRGRMDQSKGAELLQKRVAVLEQEQAFSSNSSYETAMETFRLFRTTYDKFKGMHEQEAARCLFSNYAPFLFGSPVVVRSPSGTAAATTTTRLTLQDQHSRHEPVAKIAELIHRLIDECILKRYKIEDELAAGALLDWGRKDTELQPKEVQDVEGWLESKLQWMQERCEAIHCTAAIEKDLLCQLDELALPLETIEHHVVTVVSAYQHPTPSLSGANNNNSTNQDTLLAAPGAAAPMTPPITPPVPMTAPIFNPGLLWNVAKSLLRFRDCRRLAPFLKRLHELIEAEARGACEQYSSLVRAMPAPAPHRPYVPQQRPHRTARPDDYQLGGGTGMRGGGRSNLRASLSVADDEAEVAARESVIGRLQRQWQQ